MRVIGSLGGETVLRQKELEDGAGGQRHNSTD